MKTFLIELGLSTAYFMERVSCSAKLYLWSLQYGPVEKYEDYRNTNLKGNKQNG